MTLRNAHVRCFPRKHKLLKRQWKAVKGRKSAVGQSTQRISSSLAPGPFLTSVKLGGWDLSGSILTELIIYGFEFHEEGQAFILKLLV